MEELKKFEQELKVMNSELAENEKLLSKAEIELDNEINEYQVLLTEAETRTGAPKQSVCIFP